MFIPLLRIVHAVERDRLLFYLGTHGNTLTDQFYYPPGVGAWVVSGAVGLDARFGRGVAPGRAENEGNMREINNMKTLSVWG